MKKAVLSLVIILSIFKLCAQTSGNKHVINNYKNAEVVVFGNNVYDHGKSESAVIKTDSFQTNNEVLISTENISNINAPLLMNGMYKGRDYEYYKKIYQKAIRQRNIGIPLTLFGLSSSIVGILINKDGVYSDQASITVRILFWGGALMANVGTPLWIDGSAGAVNNKAAMKMTKENASLSFSATNNGIGRVLSF